VKFDLRLPIGLLFTLLGVLLAGYGLARPTLTLGVNINLTWGTAILAFGVLMLALAARGARALTGTSSSPSPVSRRPTAAVRARPGPAAD
jgi:hypothetical protein